MITILKPGLAIENDWYNRSKPNHLNSVFVNENIELLKSFKISKIINKRITYKNRIRKKSLNTSLDRQNTDLERIVNIIRSFSTGLKYLLKNINGIFL